MAWRKRSQKSKLSNYFFINRHRNYSPLLKRHDDYPPIEKSIISFITDYHIKLQKFKDNLYCQACKKSYATKLEIACPINQQSPPLLR